MEELLKQLLDEFGIMKTEFSNISSNMATKSDIEDIKREQMASKSDIEDIKNDLIATKSDIEDIKNDLHEIKESVHRIEQSQPDDIYALLITIADKLDSRDSKIKVL